MLPLTFGIIRDEFPREKVAGAVGASAALLAVGGGVGLVLAGPVVDALSYHWLFWLPMVDDRPGGRRGRPLVVPESPVRTEGRINVGRALLLSAWLVALLLAVSQGHSWGWGSAAVVGAVRRGGGAAAGVGVGGVPQRPAAHRHADDAASRRCGPRTWSRCCSAPGCTRCSPSSRSSCRPRRRPATASAPSVTVSGLLLLPQTAATFLAGLASGRLAARFGSKVLLVVGATMTSLGTLGLVAAATTSSGRWSPRPPCSGSRSGWPSRRCRTSSSTRCRRPRPGWPAA